MGKTINIKRVMSDKRYKRLSKKIRKLRKLWRSATPILYTENIDGTYKECDNSGCCMLDLN